MLVATKKRTRQHKSKPSVFFQEITLLVIMPDMLEFIVHEYIVLKFNYIDVVPIYFTLQKIHLFEI